MKRLLFLLFVIGFGLTAFFTPPLRMAIEGALQASACDTPITYTIGTVDDRFGLSRSDVENDIEDSISLWSQAYGKTLFVYDPKAVLTVNLSFDKRQELTSQIQKMQNNLDEKNSTLQSQIQLYQKAAATFKEKLQQFNTEVDEWNQKGGAPPEVYDRLTSQQEQLKKEGDGLNSLARQLNLSTNQYNTDVGVLNTDVRQFNAELAKKPEEGLYSPSENTITIYFATDKNELLHTLAHEFGHALGLGHIDDTDAIMYPYTTKKTSLSPSDVSELQFVCRKQSVFVLWGKIIQQAARSFLNQYQTKMSGL